MKLNSQQLRSNLKQSILPIYIVSSDETFLLEQSCDDVRKACRAHGFTDREVFHIEGQNQHWDDAIASAASMSLFADKKLIELRCKSNKIGDAGSKAVLRYLEQANDDTTVLMIMPKLDKAQLNSKWMKAVQAQGALCQLWPIDRNQLPNWIGQQLQEHGINASPDAIDLLANNVEGNLLAAHQEITKLTLSNIEGTIDAQQMAQAIANSSRYTVFNLIDSMLKGDAAASLNTLRSLKAEGVEATLIVWALARELRTLHKVFANIANNMMASQALRQERVFDNRHHLYQQALQRLNQNAVEKLLYQLQPLDLAIKGMNDLNPWLQLEKLIVKIAGVRR